MVARGPKPPTSPRFISRDCRRRPASFCRCVRFEQVYPSLMGVRVEGLTTAPSQEFDNFRVTTFLRPRSRPRPRLGVVLERVSAVFKHKRGNFRAAPTAGPAQGSAFQQVITATDFCSGVQE